MPEKVAYRIRTPRLVIRCWQPADAPLLKAAIDASINHLLPWMPWAENEPTSLDEKVALLRGFRGKFDLDQEYIYAIFDPAESFVIGGTGLDPRVGSEALEIGYWIHVDHINKGYASEATAALTRVAFQVNNVQRVEIHCDVKNIRSAAVPQKLGYTLDATLRKRPLSNSSLHDEMIWSIFADEFLSKPLAALRIEAFDAAGQKIL